MAKCPHAPNRPMPGHLTPPPPSSAGKEHSSLRSFQELPIALQIRDEPFWVIMTKEQRTGSVRAIDCGEINGPWVTTSPDRICQGESREAAQLPSP